METQIRPYEGRDLRFNMDGSLFREEEVMFVGFVKTPVLWTLVLPILFSATDKPRLDHN